MENTLEQQFKTFIDEAQDLADAFATTGEDDNSYDAGGLVAEGKEMLEALEAGTLPLQEAIAWLSEATDRLDSIT